MLRHNLLLIYRNFKRFRSSFFINLIGLSTGMACTLLIFLWVKDELSVDRFHQNDHRIHQVMKQIPSGDGVEVAAEHAPILSDVLVDELPEVEFAVSEAINPNMDNLTVLDQTFKASGGYAGPEYFKVFTYPLLFGDKNRVLADEGNIVLSQQLAFKLFSSLDNPLGKEIEIEGKGQFLVSGVFDIPKNSSRSFDFLIPLTTAYKHYPNLQNNWNNQWVNTHVLVREAADLNQLNSKISNLMGEKTGEEHLRLFTRKFSDAYLYGKYENGKQEGGRIEYVRLFSILAVFILLIACINFMNLSTASASRKLKEVGIKKAIGAARKTLVFQFLGESLFMAFLSLLTAVLMVWLILPQFNEIAAKQLSLNVDPNLILVFLGITLVTGLISGSYPALYLSGFNPVTVLKGKLTTSLEELWLRKGLIVFQFVMSVILIVAVLVVYNQTQLIQNKNLGYNKNNVIYFQMEGRVKDQLDTFLSEVKQIPGVVESSSMFLTFFGNLNSTGDLSWQGKNPESNLSMQYRRVNYDLIELLEIEMAAGRSYSRYFSDTARIIFNETAIASMGLQDPIGKTVRLWNREMEIVGVAKDFHFQSLHETVKPLFLFLNPERTNNIILKVDEGKEKEVVGVLRDFYTEFNPGYVFDYRFLDQEYQAQYVAENRVSVLSKYFGGLAILISCLGLFGLATFTAERRTKEIGIRKTLGASEAEIVRLLSGEFVKLVGTAIFIGLPISYYFTQNWLENFAYKIELEWSFFIGAGVLTLLIALVTVSFQAIKAALMNPVKSLRSE